LVIVGVRVFVGVRVLVGVRVGGALFVFVGIGPLVTLPRGVFVGGGVAICAFPWKICWLNKKSVRAANNTLKRNAMRNGKLIRLALIMGRKKRGKYIKRQIYNHPTFA
jgi:hypothetical protein